MGFEGFDGSTSYISDDKLSRIVDASIALERPLLIKGEPGTGKTLLAHAVAETLNIPLIRWHIKSTTKASEGLYHYDVVQRLNDSRFGDRDVSDIRKYIKLGPMGEAFKSEQRVVLLIDEIDKADIEFPNDLLRELDEMAFTISELSEQVSAVHRPITIITSNAEKELPDAFLRRCVFHFIDFPGEEQMRKIVAVHHPQLDQDVLDAALERFYALRNQRGLRKPPSTSEFIDWLSVLTHAGMDANAVREGHHFLGVLLKQEQDLSDSVRH